MQRSGRYNKLAGAKYEILDMIYPLGEMKK